MLSDVFIWGLVNNIKFNVEIKPYYEDRLLVENTIKLIKKYHLEDRFVLTSSKYNILEEIKEIDNKSKEDIIELLKKATNITHDIALRDRELLMEECRRLYYPDKVSRNHAMYLCDEKSLDFWQSQLSKDASLFKLSITGELFLSHNDLVPNRAFSGEFMIEESKKYWEANLENCDECKSEYLFQGNAKILKKIK